MTGAQYDAAHWGATYDKANQIAAETASSLIHARNGLLAGLAAWR